MTTHHAARAALLALAVGTSACNILEQATEKNAGGSFTIRLTNKQGVSSTLDAWEAKTVAGHHNSAEQPQAGGWSIAIGTPNPLATLNKEPCNGLSLGFAGPPTAGKVITLVGRDSFPDGGVPLDGGNTLAAGAGTLVFQEGCIANNEPLEQWQATGGTVTITSVEAAADGLETPGAGPGSHVRHVKLTYSGVPMAVWGASATNPATGTFTASGEADIEAYAGMP